MKTSILLAAVFSFSIAQSNALENEPHEAEREAVARFGTDAHCCVEGRITGIADGQITIKGTESAYARVYMAFNRRYFEYSKSDRPRHLPELREQLCNSLRYRYCKLTGFNFNISNPESFRVYDESDKYGYDCNNWDYSRETTWILLNELRLGDRVVISFEPNTRKVNSIVYVEPIKVPWTVKFYTTRPKLNPHQDSHVTIDADPDFEVDLDCVGFQTYMDTYNRIEAIDDVKERSAGFQKLEREDPIRYEAMNALQDAITLPPDFLDLFSRIIKELKHSLDKACKAEVIRDKSGKTKYNGDPRLRFTSYETIYEKRIGLENLPIHYGRNPARVGFRLEIDCCLNLKSKIPECTLNVTSYFDFVGISEQMGDCITALEKFANKK